MIRLSATVAGMSKKKHSLVFTAAREGTTRMATSRTSESDLFSSWYERYSPAIRRDLWIRSHGDSRIPDWVQTAFLRAWEYRHRFDGRNPLGWLTVIARNVMLDDLRRSSKKITGFTSLDRWLVELRDTPMLVPAALMQESALEHSLRSEQTREIHQALRALTPRQRQAIYLHYIEGRRVTEIGSTDTIKGRLFHGRRNLRAQLKQAYGKSSQTSVG